MTSDTSETGSRSSLVRANAARSKHPAVRRVERAIRAGRLLSAGDRVLVAVSGGADSVFLLLALDALSTPLGITLHVAHLDHGWRGEEGRADAAFVQALADSLDLACSSERADAAAYARHQSLSPEEGARALRYEFLARACAASGCLAVATGHTSDDDLETVVLSLLRGSGPLALGGIVPSSALPGDETARLIRPLLAVNGAEIRQTLSQWGQPWREDATNAARTLPRSRVRHELLPLLEAIQPGARATVRRSASLAYQAAQFVQNELPSHAQALIVAHADGLAIDRRALLARHPAMRAAVLREAAGRLRGATTDLEAAHIEGALRAIERGRGRASVPLGPAVRLRIERNTVILSRDNHR